MSTNGRSGRTSNCPLTKSWCPAWCRIACTWSSTRSWWRSASSGSPAWWGASASSPAPIAASAPRAPATRCIRMWPGRSCARWSRARGSRRCGCSERAVSRVLTAEERLENAAAVGPEHQHHAHQRASGHHTRRDRQSELLGELRFLSLEQEGNERAQEEQKPVVPVEHPGEAERCRRWKIVLVFRKQNRR